MRPTNKDTQHERGYCTSPKWHRPRLPCLHLRLRDGRRLQERELFGSDELEASFNEPWVSFAELLLALEAGAYCVRAPCFQKPPVPEDAPGETHAPRGSSVVLQESSLADSTADMVNVGNTTMSTAGVLKLEGLRLRP